MVESINWRNVSIDVLMEFICKHQKIIENYELEKFLINSICGNTTEEENKNIKTQNDNLAVNPKTNPDTCLNVAMNTILINLFSINTIL
jgi:hypothetical protein